MEGAIRKIELPSLEWKTGELVPVISNTFALRIMCHFTDELFSVDDDLKASIEELEDYVQSVDIFSWNKK